MKKASIIAVVSLAVLLNACGQGDSAPKTTAAAPAAAPAEPATPTTAPVAAEPIAGTLTPPPAASAAVAAGADDKGKSVFNKTCALCHAACIAGAPMTGKRNYGHHASRKARKCSTSMRWKATPARLA